MSDAYITAEQLEELVATEAQKDPLYRIAQKIPGIAFGLSGICVNFISNWVAPTISAITTGVNLFPDKLPLPRFVSKMDPLRRIGWATAAGGFAALVGGGFTPNSILTGTAGMVIASGNFRGSSPENIEALASKTLSGSSRTFRHPAIRYGGGYILIGVVASGILGQHHTTLHHNGVI